MVAVATEDAPDAGGFAAAALLLLLLLVVPKVMRHGVGVFVKGSAFKGVAVRAAQARFERFYGRLLSVTRSDCRRGNTGVQSVPPFRTAPARTDPKGF